MRTSQRKTSIPRHSLPRSFQGVKIEKSTFLYVSFDYSDLRNSGIYESKMNDGSFSEVSAKNFSIHSTNLAGTSFKGTMLSSLSLKMSEIGDIYISEDARELRGAKLDVSQAMDAAKLLGIQIVE